MRNAKKSPLPIWLSRSVAELRRLLNVVWPLPRLSRALRLHWWRWRREHRLRAVASRLGLNPQRLLQFALPP